MSERDKPIRFNREARAKPGERIIAGKAPIEPGEYEVFVALTVEAPEEGGEECVGAWKLALEDFGGPVKANARKGQTFSDPGWMKRPNTDYVDCTFTDEALHSDQIAPNIRLINPTFQGLKPWTPGGSNSSFGSYINMGKKGEQKLGFVIFGGRVIGLRATEFMETKDFDPKIVGLSFVESPEIERGIRIRHGAEALIAGCRGLKRVTLRGHRHAVVDCSDTVVDMLAGNLPGEFKKWWPLKKAGKGNYQRAERCYAAGVKDVEVGVKLQKDTPMKALRCMAPPRQVRKLLEQEDFQERELSGMEELRRAE